MNYNLAAVSERIKTQDNRITENPMFCVQILKREAGFDSSYSDNRCWWNGGQMEVIYDDDGRGEPPENEEWDGPFGYKDTWETVMVAFTEGGCKEYLNLDGHNVRQQAFRGQVRIYVKSFNRCPEMIAIREMLINRGQP